MTKLKADMPYGVCSLKDAAEVEKNRFYQFREYLNGPGRAFRTQQLSEAVEVIDCLYRGTACSRSLGLSPSWC